MNLEDRLDGRTVLITGGTAGIGLAAAIRLGAAGANVVVCGRNRARLVAAESAIRAAGAPGVLGVRADCTDVDEVRDLHRAGTDAFGTVTGLVNNVGTSLKGSFLELTDEQWQRDLDLKVFAAIRLARLVISDLVTEGRPGRIVNILSIGGKHPGAGSAPTTVSRAAGIALTKVLSKEFAAHDVLVNAICIGAIKAKQHDDRWEAEADDLDRAAFYARMAAARGIPLGRVGEPEEVAGLIHFLLSDQGSYITGVAINVDGGTSSSV